MLNITIHSGLTQSRESLSMVVEALSAHSEDLDAYERISHPDAPQSILAAALDPENLCAYIFDTSDGIEDLNVDDEKYLAWVLDNVDHGWN